MNHSIGKSSIHSPDSQSPDQRIDGWDAYAPFYDWENARTMGRRDVAFWRRLTAAADGPVLELGCGTGRILLPIARSGARVVGIDRSAAMLARARARVGRASGRAQVVSGFSRTRVRPSPSRQLPRLVRGDVRDLPFEPDTFALCIAPYGMLQSLLSDEDLARTLRSVARVTRRGGMLGIDLVPDLPVWEEYRRRVKLRGRRAGGATVTLVESVRQDRRRGLTHFDEEYVERHGRARRVRRFSLSFRTLSVNEMARRLERAGFRVRAVLGDYQGGPWHADADVWMIVAVRS